MQYHETLEPLNKFYIAQTFQTQKDYENLTGKPAPEFNTFQAIKMWRMPVPLGTRPNAMYTITTLAKENGNFIEKPDGTFEFDYIPLRASQLENVNIPPVDFNFTAMPFIPVIEPPLQANFENEYDVVRAPGGMGLVARNKKKYAEFLEKQSAASPQGQLTFQTRVLADLDLIKKALKI